MITPGTMALNEHGQTLNRVLAAAEKPAYAVNIFRLLACLPQPVGLSQLDFSLENQPLMEVVAVVEAEDADQLNQTLSDLIQQLKDKFKAAQTLTLDDFDIRPETSAVAQATPRYRLSFKLGLL